MRDKAIKQPVRSGVAKVPVIMQMEALECGAASLCMVLAYYNKWIPLEQVRADCGVSRDGSNARNVLKAARSYGLNAQGYRYEPEDLQREGTFPCIIHWEFNHFVVCDGFKGDKVYLNDPAKGSYAVSRERFDESFTGIAILFEPGENFEPSGKPKSVLDFARKRLQGAGPAIAFVAITTVIASLAAILNAGFSRVFMDQLLPGRNEDWIVPFFIGLGILTLLQLVSAWIQAIYALRLNGKMAAVGSSTYLWHVLRLPMEFFSQRMAGDIQMRKESNATIASNLVNTVAPLVLNTAMMVFYLVVMLRYSVLLTAIGLGGVAINAGVSRYISAKRVNITRVMMRDAGKLSSSTASAIDMIETIKASGAENGYFEKWAGYQASVNTQNVRYLKQNQYLGLIPSAVGTVTNVAVLVLGVWLTMQGQFTAGMVFAFQGFMGAFTAPASELISAGQSIQEMRTSMERVNDVMEYPLDPVFSQEVKAQDEQTPVESQPHTEVLTQAEEQSFDKLSGTLSLRHVTFGYSKLAAPLIEDFNLELKRGQRVAFVGTSGCGKSTLSKLISGLYQPWSGEILFDGKPIDAIDRAVFTGSVAVVDQDIILFEDSIAANIRMWDNSIEDFEVIMAARDASIHEDIMRRAGGYQYKITEGGRDFSGGQRQRLEIARVLAQDPTIIIMDEATSALDARTEYEVVDSIKNRGITCIVIAHRLSTIRDCDEIIVLDRGHVVERGTHDELMALGGTYKTLVSSE
ncbi:MAG: NHLP family bacteriocin export ABC transporter peptidase/permease/ATPase subunit [Coriobacteriales bacterium]|nr:NHLP family bacteriocin export ABC transporter peptidase/permease/ATPase subunit [Coriobacteriales bacterium]